MSINLGNTAIQKAYIGATEVSNVYLGSALLYSAFNAQAIIDNFKTRVANDGGTFEAENNLLSILTALENTL